MPAASAPPDEEERQAELTALHILDTGATQEFELFVSLASKLLSTPTAAISFVDKDRQWFKAKVGLDMSQTPREFSFCAHTILAPGKVLYVPDATEDARFADNPLVTGAFGLRFYAGTSILGPGGHPLGAICAMDFRPRHVTDEVLDQLKQLASGVEGACRWHATRRHLEIAELTDPLTGLRNKAGFNVRLEEAVRRHSQGPGPALGLLLIDLSGFRAMNDLFGHRTGNALLLEIADRLRRITRLDDTLGRFDADSFGILLERIHRPGDLEAFVARIHAELGRPFQAERASLPLRASVGAVWTEQTTTAGALIDKADAALAEAKRAGYGVIRLDNDMLGGQSVVLGRLGLEAKLRSALTPGREPFTLVLQPIYEVRTAQLTGFEALVRWPLPDGTTLLPADFVRAAEANGLIVALDHWVLDHACALAASWADDLQISSNLSAANFLAGDLAADVRAILKKHNLAPRRLKLEVTESVLLRDATRVRRVMGALCDLGVQIVVDDFGAGYASIAYLRNYRFHGLKIDRSLVENIEAEPRDKAALFAVVKLAKALGLDVAAEGVETAGQLAILAQAKVRLAQGYFLGHPLTPDEAKILGDASSQARPRSQPGRLQRTKTFVAPAGGDLARSLPTHAREATHRSERARARRQAEWLRRGISVLPDPFYVKDVNHRFVAANGALARLLGTTSTDEVIGKTDDDFHDPIHARRYREHEIAIMKGAPATATEQHVQRGDGSWGWCSALKVLLQDANGAAVGLVGHIRDITEAKRVESILEQQREELLQLTDAATQSRIEAERMRDILVEAAAVLSDGFALFDPEDRLTLCNASFSHAFGAAPEQLTGLTFAALLRLPQFRSGVSLDDSAYETWLDQRLTRHYNAAGTSEEYEHGGRWFLIQERRTAHGSIVLSRAEITHLKRVEEDLRQLATRDVLTGLWNRRHFASQGSRLLERAYHDGQSVVLILFDIDHFKKINDVYGHMAGDEALRQVAFLCMGLLRPNDLIARWGGEEFVQLMLDVDVATALSVAERLRRGIANLTIICGQHNFRLTASFGLAYSNSMSWSLDKLTAQADHALYRAKRCGRDRVKVAHRLTAE